MLERERVVTDIMVIFLTKKIILAIEYSNHVFNIDILEANLSGPEPMTSFFLRKWD